MEIARHNLWQCIFIIQLYCSRFTPTTRLFLGSESMFHPVISVITALISWAMTDKHVKTLFISPIHYTVGQVCTAVAIHFVFKTTGVFSSSIQEYTLVMFSCLPFSWGGLNFEHSGCTECMLYYAKVYLPVFSLLVHCTERMEAALNAPIQLAHVNHILKKIVWLLWWYILLYLSLFPNT